MGFARVRGHGAARPSSWWSKLLDRFTGRSARARTSATPSPPFRRKPLFEALEPRLLLSGDPLVYAAQADEAFDLTLKLVQEGSAPLLQLVDNRGADFPLLASAALTETSAVMITGSDLDDTLRIDADLAAGVGSLLISFDAGAGDDTLRGPGTDVTWQITAADAGRVAGVEFTGVENLAGAADNRDEFVLGASASLSGLLDGGPRGFDTLVLDGGTFGSVSYAASGPDSGTIDRDGQRLAYRGLEPIFDNLSVAERVIRTSDFADRARLTDLGTELRLESLDGLQTFEGITFAEPSVSLTINLGDNASQQKLDPATAATAQDSIAAARDGNALEAVSFDLRYDNQDFSVAVAGGVFETPEGELDGGALVAHLQAAVDQALEAAGVGTPGEIVVALDPNGDVVFEQGPTSERLEVQALDLGADLIVDGEGGNDAITVAGDVTLAGHDLTLRAETIAVDPGVTVSTRTIAAGGDPSTAGSTGASGSIVLEALSGPSESFATSITVGRGASLLAQAGDGHLAGDVRLTAEDFAGIAFSQIIFGGPKSTAATIALDGATVKGDVVTVDAQADSADIFGDNSSASPLESEAIEFLSGLALIGGVSQARAEATITVDGGSIEARSLTLDALAQAEVNVRTVSLFLAFA
jgi:hypothetical protein